MRTCAPVELERSSVAVEPPIVLLAMQFCIVVLSWFDVTTWFAPPVMVKPWQSSVTFAAVMVKQVEPVALMLLLIL